MRRRVGRTLFLGANVAALVAACGGQSDGDTTRAGAPASADVVAEARSFMDGYARDLLAGDRGAIAARYDRTGAYMLGNGRKEFVPYDSVVAQYGGGTWSAPATFEWRELSFEPVGPDAVVIVGQFVWGRAGGAPPMTFSYASLLRRQEGVLRIRVEDESIDPASLPPQPPADSARR
jgi:hypothetical protein